MAGLLRHDGRVRPVQFHPPRVGLRQPVAQRPLAQQHRHPGIRQQEVQPFGRVGRVQRHIGAPRLQDPQQPYDHLQTALHTQPYRHIRPHP